MHTLFYRRIAIFLSILSFAIVACTRHEEVVNVYSGRHYQSDEELFEKFTRETGIRVNLIKADSDQLIQRMLIEGERSPADLFITADIGRITMGLEQGLFQPIQSELVTQLLPSNLYDPQLYWVGLTKRARVIVYHQDRVDPSDIRDYEDLADSRWKGRILVRSSQSHYNQTLLASILAADGYDKALEWARNVVANMAQPPRGNDRDQMKAIAAGVGDVSLVNTYYLGQMLHSGNEEERNVARTLGVIFPNQDNRGTHVNVSGMAIPSQSKNPANAIRLIEFLLRKDSQEFLAQANYEYPVNPSAELPDLLQQWGNFREDTINLSRLGKYVPDAMRIFNLAGWN